MTLFVDTAVVTYAAGPDHPLRAPCQRIIDAVGARSLDGVISSEVVQEILDRYLAIGRRESGIALASRTLDLFAPVLPITDGLMRRVPDLLTRYPNLGARDALHVATCVDEGIAEILSPDRVFDAIAEVRRVDPMSIRPAPD